MKYKALNKKNNIEYDVLQIDFEHQRVKISNGDWLRNENHGDGIMVIDGNSFKLSIEGLSGPYLLNN